MPPRQSRHVELVTVGRRSPNLAKTSQPRDILQQTPAATTGWRLPCIHRRSPPASAPHGALYPVDLGKRVHLYNPCDEFREGDIVRHDEHHDCAAVLTGVDLWLGSRFLRPAPEDGPIKQDTSDQRVFATFITGVYGIYSQLAK